MSPRRQLEKSIEHLREELAEGEPLTAADRALLERTLEEVAAELDESREDSSMTESVTSMATTPPAGLSSKAS